MYLSDFCFSKKKSIPIMLQRCNVCISQRSNILATPPLYIKTVISVSILENSINGFDYSSRPIVLYNHSILMNDIRQSKNLLSCDLLRQKGSQIHLAENHRHPCHLRNLTNDKTYSSQNFVPKPSAHIPTSSTEHLAQF